MKYKALSEKLRMQVASLRTQLTKSNLRLAETQDHFRAFIESDQGGTYVQWVYAMLEMQPRDHGSRFMNWHPCVW
jgi:hypothetical protein